MWPYRLNAMKFDSEVKLRRKETLNTNGRFMLKEKLECFAIFRKLYVRTTWLHQWLTFNSSPPGQNGWHFADDVFICNFLDEKWCIFIRISLKCVSHGPIDNKSVLVQVMAWRRTCDKPLPERMVTQFTDAYMRHWGEMSLDNVL